MGVTISHTNYAPISLVSTLIGFVSFAFTLGTFLKLFWSNLGTFAAAPHEINDYLSSLKQGLLEERRHLRRVRRRLKSVKRDQSHGPGARSASDDDYQREGHAKKRWNSGKTGRKRGRMHFDRDIQSMRSSGEEEALRVMRVTVKDLIKSFRELEQPFLKAEYQQQDPAHWSTQHSPFYPEKRPQHHANSDDDSPGASHMHATNRLGHEYRTCGFKERWVWVRKKAAVLNLSSVLSRVEVRRTAHEVGEVLSMVCNIGRDLEDLRESLDGVEGRLNRVVGVRRVD
ncbi:hypothetical protein CC86DRAFT_304452 [Ophiobolus disseminans]|uniref:Uncharacterized protein n=1 Tax=Ophiobolus disseminans TaxID=1469910 RepID=A0A6A6ZI90_9PLEO|nr:hypothetical protein CC86DRAFT_304452 [Ophiobolus disseminans]